MKPANFASLTLSQGLSSLFSPPLFPLVGPGMISSISTPAGHHSLKVFPPERYHQLPTHHNISLDVQCWCCCSCLGPIPLLPLHPCIHSKQLIFFNSNFCIALSQNLNVSETYKSVSYQTHCKYGLEKSEMHTQRSPLHAFLQLKQKKKKFY